MSKNEREICELRAENVSVSRVIDLQKRHTVEFLKKLKKCEELSAGKELDSLPVNDRLDDFDHCSNTNNWRYEGIS